MQHQANNIFNRIAMDEVQNSFSLGSPAQNLKLRLQCMGTLTGGKGFRLPGKQSDGSRRAAKKAAREIMINQIVKERVSEFFRKVSQ